MKNNNSKAILVINAMLTGLLIGAVLSLPIVFLAIEFRMSLLLSILVPVAFFGMIMPISAASMWSDLSGRIDSPQV